MITDLRLSACLVVVLAPVLFSRSRLGSWGTAAGPLLAPHKSTRSCTELCRPLLLARRRLSSTAEPVRSPVLELSLVRRSWRPAAYPCKSSGSSSLDDDDGLFVGCSDDAAMGLQFSVKPLGEDFTPEREAVFVSTGGSFSPLWLVPVRFTFVPVPVRATSPLVRSGERRCLSARSLSTPRFGWAFSGSRYVPSTLSASRGFCSTIGLRSM